MEFSSDLSGLRHGVTNESQQSAGKTRDVSSIGAVFFAKNFLNKYVKIFKDTFSRCAKINERQFLNNKDSKR